MLAPHRTRRVVKGMATSPQGELGSTIAGFVAGAAVVVAGVLALDRFVLGQDRAQPPAPGAPPASASPGTFRDAYSEVASGVVRIGMTGCAGGGMGSGALLEPDLVATSAHVVHDYATLQLILGDQVTSGEVVAYVPEADVALVRAARPLTGHVFTVVDELPGVGSEVAAVGYPLDGPLSMAGPGIVGAYGEHARYQLEDGDVIDASELMRISVLTNPGNSGGPVIDRDGSLVGLVSGQKNAELDDQGNVIVEDVDGIRYATTATQVRDALAAADESALPPEQCSDAPAPETEAELVTTNLEATATTEAVRSVLFDYFDGINESDYERAYRQLSPERRERLSLERFTQEQSTSVVTDVVLLDVSEAGDELRALATFTSTQTPEFGPDGLECAYWTLEYRLVAGGEHGWTIAASEEIPGTPRFQPCS